MPTCAEVLARTLKDAGVTRMFGLPGGEMLDFLEAARRAGIRFILTRHEATAAFMADVTGQIQRRPGVCVATLGPGAVNMTLGVANAYLDRSPVVAITAALARSSAPYATHQQLDLNAVYRPFTKQAITLDGEDTEGKVREALRITRAPRMGPVHIALPSDVARGEDRPSALTTRIAVEPPPIGPASADAIERVAAAIAAARRPIVILGLDLDPRTDVAAVRAFVKHMGAPTFVTPKAKGLLPEDHPLFGGVCAGVAGDRVVLDLFSRADLLLGIGFEPVESDKLWHHTMPLVSVGPVSIAAVDFRPQAEAVGDVAATLAELGRGPHVPHAWEPATLARFREDLERVLRPVSKPKGLSGFELTRALRGLSPRDTILATDVGSIKSITSQAWAAYEPLTFFESNGLSAMSYSFPAAMAARLRVPRSSGAVHHRRRRLRHDPRGDRDLRARADPLRHRRLQRQRAEPHRRCPAESRIPDLRRPLRAGGLRGGGGGNGRLVAPCGDAGGARVHREGRAGPRPAGGDRGDRRSRGVRRAPPPAPLSARYQRLSKNVSVQRTCRPSRPAVQ